MRIQNKGFSTILLSLTLSLGTVFSLLPVSVFAEGEEVEETEEIENGSSEEVFEESNEEQNEEETELIENSQDNVSYR